MKIIALLLIVTSLAVSGDPVTVSWNSNSEPDLSGYKLYYGHAERKYHFVIDVGNITEFDLDLPVDIQYYFAVTAYDTADNESKYSDEVRLLLLTLPGDYNINFEVTFDDLLLFLDKFGCDLTSKLYDAAWDFNKDGYIEFHDLYYFIKHLFGSYHED